MTSDTSARETPASRATSSMVTYGPRRLPASSISAILPAVAIERIIALERSKESLDKRRTPSVASVRLERSKISWGRKRRRARDVERGVPATGRDARLAAAPISWGVCEVPGWGLQLRPDRVLAEMAQLGLSATELGPLGWLPLDGNGVRRALRRHGPRPVGGRGPPLVRPQNL